jgi:hypothetical protein
VGEAGGGEESGVDGWSGNRGDGGVGEGRSGRGRVGFMRRKTRNKYINSNKGIEVHEVKDLAIREQ